ncbi:MAG: GNAT superfamily N-acetyltransferase [Bacteroidia bacterium]|jgi:GNAT superfamily N-acetyltransferase
MNTFLSYDQFRLGKFKDRKPCIQTASTKALSYFLFDEVDYFNYLFIKERSILNSDLMPVIDEFIASGRDRIKIICKQSSIKFHRDLIDEDVPIKKIVCVHKTWQVIGTTRGPSILQKVVSDSDIRLFTTIYLRGFESNANNEDEVAQNFTLLHKSGETHFYFVTYRGKVAGICANHFNRNHVFLSACAVLAPYRNLGLQKVAIQERLQLAHQQGYRRATSWAYANGISHHNLVKSGFTEYEIYGEAISKSLELLRAERGILSEQACSSV